MGKVKEGLSSRVGRVPWSSFSVFFIFNPNFHCSLYPNIVHLQLFCAVLPLSTEKVER